MPKLASTEGGGRRWLPRELTYELLQFVSGKFWSARRLLTTSAVLFRIIINGKHAKIWRQPYDVRERERAYETAIFPSLNGWALLLRVHANQLPYCRPFGQYQFVSGQRSSFQVLIILDPRKFVRQPLNILNTQFCQQLNAREHFMVENYGLSLVRFHATFQDGEEFVMLHFTFDEPFLRKLIADLQSLLKYLVTFVDETYPSQQNA
ncbi:hypothetical protein GPALN_004034 [Globodera pallida]|nr:hypothetical protein GPALN_004034 [Globodera pallida]